MYTRALNMLLPYLLSWRTRLARADAAERSPSPVKTPKETPAKASPRSSPGRSVAGAAEGAAEGSPPAPPPGAGAESPQGGASPLRPPREQLELQRLATPQRRHLAVLLDTALLKVLAS